MLLDMLLYCYKDCYQKNSLLFVIERVLVVDVDADYSGWLQLPIILFRDML